MPFFSGLFNIILFIQIAIYVIGFAVAIVAVVAVWRTMKAHESVARSLNVVAQEMSRRNGTST